MMGYLIIGLTDEKRKEVDDDYIFSNEIIHSFMDDIDTDIYDIKRLYRKASEISGLADKCLNRVDTWDQYKHILDVLEKHPDVHIVCDRVVVL